MKKHIILFLLFGIITVIVTAATPAEQYEAANRLYKEKKFDEAAQAYEALLKAGAVSSEVYFNLGNAYYKSGQVSKAILNFERAKVLNPADDDIQFNLRLAYSGTVDKIEPIPLLFYQRWWQSFLHFLTPSGWGTVAIGLIWLTLAIAIYYLFAPTPNAKRNSFLAALTFFLISLFGFFISFASENILNNKNGAIVIETSAYIKSSPEDKSTNLFLLHEGTRVEVLKEAEGWKQIRIANGNVGWIQDGQLEMI